MAIIHCSLVPGQNLVLLTGLISLAEYHSRFPATNHTQIASTYEDNK